MQPKIKKLINHFIDNNKAYLEIIFFDRVPNCQNSIEITINTRGLSLKKLCRLLVLLEIEVENAGVQYKVTLESGDYRDPK